ncbi:MAG: GAF domain-containing protein, partial [Anaerolinea sp.]|nr:GAF domain-containing protein [Anaerolinea sp.]
MSATTDVSRLIPRTATEARLDNRIGMALALLALVVAVIAAGAFLSLAVTWRGEPFLGALFTRTLTIDGSTPISEGGFAALTAGMRRGDRFMAINGEALPVDDYEAAMQRIQAIRRALDPTEPITVEFTRPIQADVPLTSKSETCTPVDETLATCTVVYIPGTFSDTDFIAFFVVPYISGLIALSIGIGVVVLRPNLPYTRLIAVNCVLAGGFMMGIFDVNSSHQLVPLWILATVMLGGSMASTAIVFPMKLPIALGFPVIRFLPLTITLIIALILIEGYISPFSPNAGTDVLQTASGIALIGMLLVVAGAMRSRERATTSIVRDQSNVVLIGVAVSLLVGVIWFINLIFRPTDGVAAIPFNTSAAMPFFLVPLLSLAYAVLQYRTLDTDRILSRAITYSLMLFALVIGFFLLMFSASMITRVFVGADNPVLLALVAFLTAVLFNPIRLRLQDRIDAIYFRRKVNFQAKNEVFASQLTALTDFNSIVKVFKEQIEGALLPSQLFIFLPDRQTGDFVADNTDVRFTATSGLVERLGQGDPVLTFTPGEVWDRLLVIERPRLLILKASVVIGLRSAERVLGFVVIAPPRSKAPGYSFDEINFLRNMTAQMSVAVERAQVVDSLQQRVRELDVLSQVSQAVNFTIDYDDLLELISAQSERLIDLTHFYITLRDPNTNELYHAFFLENRDRFTEKENLRWTLGNDLFSEVIRTGQPRCVANYTRELAQNGGSFIHEDKNLKAWMAVPLVAAGRTLGVIAAGTVESGRTFNDAQLKIFIDIASLAATSIDKARLFAETNVRARQLGVLNDISRQLVAAEGDLEGLLNFITSSAVDILNAEAGSLLLTVDDGSRDLEFRVAVGGSGQEIIGTRIPAGRGLVGEVASKGQVVIVNDAR